MTSTKIRPHVHAGDFPCTRDVTVRKLTLDGHVIDTYATEAELNGWRATQATLFELATPAPQAPKEQGTLL
jgi:hypothetical protein